MIYKFRRLHKCQNGHENYLYFELHGDKLFNFTWGEPKCKCPKFAIGEGYSPIAETEIIYNEIPLDNRDIPIKPTEDMFEGEDCFVCPSCGNWKIGRDKYCPDCGQRLDHEFTTHEDYSGV
jgi:hypothetical protein